MTPTTRVRIRLARQMIYHRSKSQTNRPRSHAEGNRNFYTRRQLPFLELLLVRELASFSLMRP